MTTETQDAGLILSPVPEDEQARSAILLRFPCEQDHKGITKWINTLWEGSNMPAYNKRVRIHCKAGSVSARLVFETRAKCQDFVARCQDDGIAYEINSPFCCAKTTFTVRHLCGECWQISSKCSSLMEMTKVHLSSQRSTHAHKSSSIKDRRNGFGKPVFKLASFGSG